MKNAINYYYKSQEELIELITQQQIQLTDQQKKLSEQQKQILFLEEYIEAQKLRQFANKSEKSNVFQISLFNEAALPKNAETLSQEDESITVASYQRSANKVGRKPLPNDLPRIQRIYDLKEDEKLCACGCQLTHITDEKSEQLEIIPAKIYVIEHIRKKYACKQCEEIIKIATMPPLPIPRSIAASGLLSYVIIAKFQDHLPLYRQEKILKRLGIDLPRATLCLWVLKVAALLKPLMKLLHDYIINYDVAYADETTVQVLKEPNKGIQSKKYMWLIAGGPPKQFAFYYQYHPSRSHAVLEDYFADFKGYLHCDGYPGYDSLVKKNNHITLSGCLYHARRSTPRKVRANLKVKVLPQKLTRSTEYRVLSLQR